ncbi:uncharacterized protein LOC107769213 [Nicotiana tabacum]|uniref:Uncharacterized protein LOC107769213 n=2 Tax=Nicotiana TaxID=4085 RepID=A0A1S3XW11_TOBAC|nr:PREDICTED: uncharacterized protein LOC104229621 [Nicotiana sylvestris]XP_016443897.1 PREDICTED: uncharacterized protein LOC107769213 [Nicotiana tabacum]
MSALESPLEALAFNYLSFGLYTVVNNIWTWLAVIAAAFSFWRIKTSSALLKPALVRGDFSDDASPSLPQTAFVPPSEHVETVAADEPASTSRGPSITAPTTISPSVVFHIVHSTKGRLTTYFKQDDVLGPCDDYVDCRDSTDKGESISSQWVQSSIFSNNGTVEMEDLMCNDWYQSWEKVIRTKKGEIGWYSYQDLHVIDGNVVRLWEGCRRRREAEATAFLGGVVKTW